MKRQYSPLCDISPSGVDYSMLPSAPLSSVVEISIRYHDNGALSVGGNIKDKKFALQLLEHAKDAILREVAEPNEIVIPNKDVSVTPDRRFLPAAAKGDMRC